MSDGYEDWLGIAPEGKIPMRHGTDDDPEAYVTAWKERPPVSTPRHPCRSSTTPPRWSPSSPGRLIRPVGDTAGPRSVLAGEAAGQYVVPAAIAGIIGGNSAAEAMRTAALEVSMIKNELRS